ncbi:hypothetical protein [Aureliella helgolandensis]|uniref:hypothetical protein n=1 Tax=Aureliella helgolandensis TaxID=2527968 RepID=UPI001E5FCBD3|nr:hypothetical protein [Aureliella helgolandensis]
MAAATLVSATGCSLFPDVRHKPQLLNPFPQIKRVAVLPFFNQSEDPTLSGERVALAYMNEVQAIRGFEVLPLGVVKSKLATYQGPLSEGEHFQEFARYLDVDAVLIGSITDYDSYYPPRMSLAVNWYAANPAFHPVLPGYGLPWGTKREKEIPTWIHSEAQRSLAVEQLKTQTPLLTADVAAEAPPLQVAPVPAPEPAPQPIMPEDRLPAGQLEVAPISWEAPLPGETVVVAPELAGGDLLATGEAEQWANSSDQLPADWPDARGFLPDPPSSKRPDFRVQHDPIISHMRNFNGHDESFTEQLSEYFYFRDDARFGGWQAYLQRSEDFIRFCCYLHLSETLIARGGQDESRLILRWPLDRYTR